LENLNWRPALFRMVVQMVGPPRNDLKTLANACDPKDAPSATFTYENLARFNAYPSLNPSSKTLANGDTEAMRCRSDRPHHQGAGHQAQQ
jgi:hypothetical protein